MQVIEASYGWHTSAWISVAVLAGFLFFRFGGFGVDRHENLPEEDTPASVSWLNWAVRMVCGLVLAAGVQAALLGWPFFGWRAQF